MSEISESALGISPLLFYPRSFWHILGFLDSNSVVSTKQACKLFSYYSVVAALHELRKRSCAVRVDESTSNNSVSNEVSGSRAKRDCVRVCGVIQSRQRRGKNLTFLHLESLNNTNVQIILMRDWFCETFSSSINPSILSSPSFSSSSLTSPLSASSADSSPQASEVYDAYVSMCVPGSTVWCEGLWDTERSKPGWVSVYGDRVVLVRCHSEAASIMRVVECVAAGTMTFSEGDLSILNRLAPLLALNSIDQNDSNESTILRQRSHKQIKKEMKRAANPVCFLGRNRVALLKQEVLKVSRLLKGLEEEKEPRWRPPRIPKSELVILSQLEAEILFWPLITSSFISSALLLLQQLEDEVYQWPLQQIQQQQKRQESVRSGDFDLTDQPQTQRGYSSVDEKRKQWLESKKSPQVRWITQHVTEMIQLMRSRNREVTSILDVGGGQGDLAVFLARAFPRINLTVIDVNQSALRAGELSAQRAGLSNIRFVHADISHAKIPMCDIVVGLHSCGGLSDAILELALRQRCSFLVCTCCFGKNQSLLPVAKSFCWTKSIHFNLDERISSAAAQFTALKAKFPSISTSLSDLISRLAESEDLTVSRRAMHVVNSLRLMGVSSCGYNTKLLAFDSSWSPKNQVLWGISNS